MNTNYFILLILSIAALFNTQSEGDKTAQKAMIATAYGISVDPGDGIDPGTVDLPLVNLTSYNADGSILAVINNTPISSIYAEDMVGVSNVIEVIDPTIIISAHVGVSHSGNIVQVPAGLTTYLFYISNGTQKSRQYTLDHS